MLALVQDERVDRNKKYHFDQLEKNGGVPEHITAMINSAPAGNFTLIQVNCKRVLTLTVVQLDVYTACIALELVCG